MLRSMAPRLAILVATAALAPACSGGGTKYIGANRTTSPADAGAPTSNEAGVDAAQGCAAAPVPPPASLGLAAFYRKYLDAEGIPVLSSGNVADGALTQTCEIVMHMLVKRADVRQAMIDNRLRMAAIGVDEVLTDLPELSDLYSTNPETDWDRLRGAGATVKRPVSSCGEENLLCLQGDIYQGQSIMVEMVAYAMERLGIEPIDATFARRRQALYDDAMAAGRFADSYAAKDSVVYWAVGVQDWFDANREVSPADGVYNEINTRSELKAYDPGLAALIGEYLPDDAWRPTCP